MLYADDTVLYFSAKTVEELEIVLGLDMNNISSTWMQENKLFLNKGKTEYVIYGTWQNPQLQDKTSLLYEGTELNRVLSYKYLGVFIDQHLSFNDHVEYPMKETSKKLGALRRSRCNLTIAATDMIFKAMILPTLDYCDVVWQGCGQGNIVSLEKRRAANLIYPKSGIEINELLSRLNLITLSNRRKIHTVTLVKKCLLGFVPTYLLNYFQLNATHSYYRTRKFLDISLPKIRLEVSKWSFYYTGAAEYSRLPQNIKFLSSLKDFNRALWSFYSNE